MTSARESFDLFPKGTPVAVIGFKEPGLGWLEELVNTRGRFRPHRTIIGTLAEQFRVHANLVVDAAQSDMLYTLRAADRATYAFYPGDGKGALAIVTMKDRASEYPTHLVVSLAERPDLFEDERYLDSYAFLGAVLDAAATAVAQSVPASAVRSGQKR
jgi:hypothetical protein